MYILPYIYQIYALILTAGLTVRLNRAEIYDRDHGYYILTIETSVSAVIPLENSIFKKHSIFFKLSQNRKSSRKRKKNNYT